MMVIRDEFLIVLIMVLLVTLVAQIFYLIMLQNTLKAVNAHNRQMQPGEVWLVFIPFFGLVWQFITVTRIADSLKKEFEERGITIGEDRPGHSLGIAYCSLFCAGIIPGIGGLASLAGLVVWIIYWTKVAGFKNKLGNPGAQSDEILD